MWYKNHDCQIHNKYNTYLPKISPYEPFWKHWKQKFHLLILVSATHPDIRLFLKSHSEFVKERKRHFHSKNWYIIHPFSIFQKCRELLMGLIWSTIIIFDIFTGAFYIRLSDEKKYEPLKEINYIFNLICCLDLILNFITGYVDSKTKHIILEQKLIVKKYLKTYFFIDVVAVKCFVEQFWFISSSLDNKYDILLYKTFLIILWLRIGRIYTIIKFWKWYLEFLQVSYTFQYPLYIVCMGLYLIHTCACLRIIVPDIIRLISREQDSESWITRLNMKYTTGNRTISSMIIYVHSFLGTLYNFNNRVNDDVYPENLEDIIMSLLSIIFGYVYSGFRLILMYSLISDQYTSAFKFKDRISMAKSHMILNKIDEKYLNVLISVYKFKYFNDYIYEDIIMNKISNTLYHETFLQTAKGLFENSPLFQNMSDQTVTAVMRCLTKEVYLANEVVIKEGSKAKHMYFLASGIVAVYHDGKELHHLHDGDHFGEGELIRADGRRRTLSVIAVENCEIYKMAKSDFDKIVKQYHDFYQKMLKMYSTKHSYSAKSDSAIIQ